MATDRYKKDPKWVDDAANLIAKLTDLTFVEVKNRMRKLKTERSFPSVADCIQSFMDADKSENQIWEHELATELILIGDDAASAESDKSAERPAQKVSKRTSLRDSMWPDADSLVWQRKKHQGFSTIPKELPLIMNIADHLSGARMDVSKVYLTLWCNVWDNGFVQVPSPEKMAFEAGYFSKKRGTEWRKRIASLKEMGFIDTKPGAAGDDEYVLIVDPIGAVERLIEARREEIPEAMINSLREKSIAFGK